MKTYSTVKKPFAQRVFELSQSLRIIQDSVTLIKRGQEHQIIPLSGQLRSLLIDKHKTNKPLLLTVAKELKEELNFYRMQKAEIPADGLVLTMSGFPVSLEQELPGQIMTGLEEFLSTEVISFGANLYSMRDIIEFYANKAGGAHYAADMPADLAQLLTMNFFGQPLIAHALLQFGEVVYKLGHRLFKKLVDTEIHLLLVIPEKVESVAYALDFRHASSPMRLSFKIHPSITPSFEVRGLAGNYSAVQIERVIDWNRPHHVILSIEIEEDLSTSLSMCVDGERIAKSTSPELIVAINDPSIYDLYINRSAENPDSGLVMACAELLVYNVTQSVLDKAKNVVAFGEILLGEEIPCTYFSKDGYAHIGQGKKEFEYNGKYVQWDMKKLVRGEKPF